MSLLRRAVYLMIAVFLLVPAVAFAETKPKEVKTEVEMSSSIKSKSNPKMQKISKSKHGNQSVHTSQSTNPKDYPLIGNGGGVDILIDSWGTGHYIVFDSVKGYSSKEMNVKVGYVSDDSYLKDSLLDIEFYKESKGKLNFSGFTHFDTYGYEAVWLNSLLSKAEFKNQKYIYIRLGVYEDYDDEYFSDVTTFKVKNPFYDITPPAVPSVSPVSNKDKKVTGKAEARSKVTVKAGSKVLSSATADKTGKFTVTLKSAQKAGTVLYVTATDNVGNVSKARKVTVLDKTPPSAPKVNKVTIKSTTVTGKAEANSTVYVKVGKKVIGSAKVSKKGSFSVKIKKQKAGTAILVYAKDKAGNTGKATKTTVKEK